MGFKFVRMCSDIRSTDRRNTMCVSPIEATAAAPTTAAETTTAATTTAVVAAPTAAAGAAAVPASPLGSI